MWQAARFGRAFGYIRTKRVDGPHEPAQGCAMLKLWVAALAPRGLGSGALASPGGANDPLVASADAAHRDDSAHLDDAAPAEDESRSTTQWNADLLARLKAGDASARTELVVRYRRLVTKIVFRSLGSHSEVEDTVHDVFVEALDKVRQVHHAEALTVWMMRVTTSVVRAVLRRRSRRRWLQLFAPNDLPEQEVQPVDGSAREVLQHMYNALDRLPDAERMAFTLRYLCDLDLADTAESCGCSLATIKRRLVRAEQAFLELAADDPLLRTRIQQGTRWGDE